MCQLASCLLLWTLNVTVYLFLSSAMEIASFVIVFKFSRLTTGFRLVYIFQVLFFFIDLRPCMKESQDRDALDFRQMGFRFLNLFLLRVEEWVQANIYRQLTGGFFFAFHLLTMGTICLPEFVMSCHKFITINTKGTFTVWPEVRWSKTPYSEHCVIFPVNRWPFLQSISKRSRTGRYDVCWLRNYDIPYRHLNNERWTLVRRDYLSFVTDSCLKYTGCDFVFTSPMKCQSYFLSYASVIWSVCYRASCHCPVPIGSFWTLFCSYCDRHVCEVCKLTKHTCQSPVACYEFFSNSALNFLYQTVLGNYFKYKHGIFTNVIRKGWASLSVPVASLQRPQ